MLLVVLFADEPSISVVEQLLAVSSSLEDASPYNTARNERQKVSTGILTRAPKKDAQANSPFHSFFTNCTLQGLAHREVGMI